MYNCTFESNIAPEGGAVYVNDDQTNATFVGCTFLGNNNTKGNNDITRADTTSTVTFIPSCNGTSGGGREAGQPVTMSSLELLNPPLSASCVAERDLLLNFYRTTSPIDGWASVCQAEGWKAAITGGPGPCENGSSWHGLGCDSDGYVTSIDLSACGLVGSFLGDGNAPSIFILSRLKSLTLDSSNLQGNLPPDLCFALSLQFLSIKGEPGMKFGLSGKLDGLSALSALQLVDLHYNKFTGSLPSFARSSTTISYLSLASNALTGTIPQDYARLSKLSILGLAHNRLSGNLDFIGKFQGADLGIIFLRYNSFTGMLPKFSSNVAVLDLDHNNLTDFGDPDSICTNPLPIALFNATGCSSDYPNQPAKTCCMASNSFKCSSSSRSPGGIPWCLALCNATCKK